MCCYHPHTHWNIFNSLDSVKVPQYISSPIDESFGHHIINIVNTYARKFVHVLYMVDSTILPKLNIQCNVNNHHLWTVIEVSIVIMLGREIESMYICIHSTEEVPCIRYKHFFKIKKYSLKCFTWFWWLSLFIYWLHADYYFVALAFLWPMPI